MYVHSFLFVFVCSSPDAVHLHLISSILPSQPHAMVMMMRRMLGILSGGPLEAGPPIDAKMRLFVFLVIRSIH